MDSINDFGKKSVEEKTKIISDYIKEENIMLFNKNTKKTVEGTKSKENKGKRMKDRLSKSGKSKSRGKLSRANHAFVKTCRAIFHALNPVTWFKAIKDFFTSTKESYTPSELVGTPFQQWVFKVKTRKLKSMFKKMNKIVTE